MRVCFTHRCVKVPCACLGLMKIMKGPRFPENGVTDSCHL